MKRIFTVLCLCFLILLFAIIRFGDRFQSSDVTSSTLSKQAVEVAESPSDSVPTSPRVSPSNDPKPSSQNLEHTHPEPIEPERIVDRREEYTGADWTALLEEVLASEAMVENTETTKPTQSEMEQAITATAIVNGRTITLRPGEMVLLHRDPGATHPRPLTEEEKERVRILDHRLMNDPSLTPEEEAALEREIDEIMRPASLGSEAYGRLIIKPITK